jgi:hypothetical protein
VYDPSAGGAARREERRQDRPTHDREQAEQGGAERE